MRERLQRRDWRFVAVCLAVALLCGLVSWRYFTRAFPEASIEFKVNRAQSREVANAFLRQLDYDPAGYDHAAVFDYDDQTKIFLERKLGLERAQQVYGRPVRLWRWSHRWFKPQQKEEFRVDVTTAGEIVHFERLLPEEAEGARLDSVAARRLAEAYLVRRMGARLADYEFVERASTQLPHRTDHVFTWKKHGFEISDATYRVRVQVSGEIVTKYEEFLDIPDAWQDDYTRLRARNETAGMVASLFVLLTVLAMIGTLVLRFRDRDVRWRTVLVFGAVAFALQLLAALNDFESQKFEYSTENSYASFVTEFVLLAVLGALAYAGVVLLFTAAAEPVYRQRFPDKMSLSAFFTRRGLYTKGFFEQVLLGITLTLFFAAYQTVFYIVATRLGAWAPLEVPYSNMLNTALPWAVVLFIGFFPAVSEEFSSRMFSIPFVERLLGRAGLGRRAALLGGVLVSSYIWGFAHSSYPNQPFYIRGLEVGSAGLLVSLVMLRWGILATLVWHYTVDAFYTAFLMLRSGNTYFVVSGWVAAGLMLVPLVLSLVLYRRRGGFEPEQGLRNADEPGPLPVAPAAAEVAAPASPYLGVPRRRLATGGVVAAALLLLYAVPAEEPGEGIVFRSARTEALGAARAHLRSLGADPDSFRVAVAVASRYEPEVAAYVLERMPLRNLNELYTTYLRTPVWRLRFFRPEHKEEWFFNLPVNEAPGARSDTLPEASASAGSRIEPQAGTAPGRAADPRPAIPLWAFEHVMSESAPGDTLSLVAARRRAEAFLRERGLRPADLALKESGSERQKARIDHTFEWEVPDNTLGDAGIRYLVVVRGGAVAAMRPYMHLPESWQRDYRQESVLHRILWVLSRGVLGILGLVLAVVFVGQVRAQRFPWRASLRWGACIGAMTLVLVALRWQSDWLMRYDTAWPYRLFLVGMGIGMALQFLLLGLFAAVVVGTAFALWPESRQLFAGRRSTSYVRDACILALLGVVLQVGLERLVAVLHDVGSPWAQIQELRLLMSPARGLPWLDAYLPLLRSGVYVLGALVVFTRAGREVLGTWRSVALVAVAVVLFAAADARSPQQFALQLAIEAARAAALVFVLAYLYRGNALAYVLTYLVGQGLGTAYEWIRQPAPGLRDAGLVLAVLVGLTILALLRLAARPSGPAPPAADPGR